MSKLQYGAKRKIGRWPKTITIDETRFNVMSTGKIGITSLGDGCKDEMCTEKYTFLEVKESIQLVRWLIDANNFILINKGRFEQ